MSEQPGYRNILVERRGAVGIVTLNRPAALNALNAALISELAAALDDLEDDAAIGAIVLTGNEKAFAAGADVKEMVAKSYPEIYREDFITRGWERVGQCRKPVIAAVAGFALGGGCEIAMACTMRLASSNAKLGQPEVKLGIIPGYGGTQRLPRLVGKGIAMQLVLTGEMISADDAYRIGLVNEVTAPGDLLPRAEALAQKIIANAPLAIQYAMEAVNHGLDLTLAEGLYLEATLFGVCCATQDKTEGTTAFLEKRAAAFKGR